MLAGSARLEMARREMGRLPVLARTPLKLPRLPPEGGVRLLLGLWPLLRGRAGGGEAKGLLWELREVGVPAGEASGLPSREMPGEGRALTLLRTLLAAAVSDACQHPINVAEGCMACSVWCDVMQAECLRDALGWLHECRGSPAVLQHGSGKVHKA